MDQRMAQKLKGYLQKLNQSVMPSNKLLFIVSKIQYQLVLWQQQVTYRTESLDQLEPSFMYTQIMKEILLTIQFEEKHFQEFLEYCQDVLADNLSELQKVEKLKRQYRQETPIWWYTYECFLYPMLNRALRTLDTDLIITLGFFIKDLHLQIEQLHKKQFGSL